MRNDEQLSAATARSAATSCYCRCAIRGPGAQVLLLAGEGGAGRRESCCTQPPRPRRGLCVLRAPAPLPARLHCDLQSVRGASPPAREGGRGGRARLAALLPSPALSAATAQRSGWRRLPSTCVAARPARALRCSWGEGTVFAVLPPVLPPHLTPLLPLPAPPRRGAPSLPRAAPLLQLGRGEPAGALPLPLLVLHLTRQPQCFLLVTSRRR